MQRSTEFVNGLKAHSIAVAVHEELEGAHAMVQRMVNGDAVVTHGHLLTAWLTSVCKALEGFIYYEKTEEESKPAETKASDATPASEESKTVVGQQALQLLFNSVTTKPIADVLLKDLSIFVVWRHLLTDDQVDAIAKARNGLMKSIRCCVKDETRIQQG
eukprot:6472562-Amphidinium_carterae.1